MGAGASLVAELGESVTEQQCRNLAATLDFQNGQFEQWVDMAKDLAGFPVPRSVVLKQIGKWQEAQAAANEKRLKEREARENLGRRQVDQILQADGVNGLSAFPAELQAHIVPRDSEEGRQLHQQGLDLLGRLHEYMSAGKDVDELEDKFEETEWRLSEFFLKRVKLYEETFPDLTAPACRQAIKLIGALNQKYLGGYSTAFDTNVVPDPHFAEWKSTSREVQQQLRKKGKPLRQNRTELNDLYIDAAMLKPVVEPMLAQIAAEAGAELKAPPLKAMFRALEKATVRYDERLRGSTDSVYDLLRFSIECRDFDAVNKVVKGIVQHPLLHVQRFKDRFLKPTDAGWMDIVLNICFKGKPKNRHRFEVQVHHHAFVGMREDLGGHTIYAVVRSVSEMLECIHGAAALGNAQSIMASAISGGGRASRMAQATSRRSRKPATNASARPDASVAIDSINSGAAPKANTQAGSSSLQVGRDEFDGISDDDEEEKLVLVLDLGSHMVKAGFGGDDAPKVVFPSVCGVLRAGVGGDDSSFFVGDEATAKRDVLQMSSPFDAGNLPDVTTLEKVLRHTLQNKLRIPVDDHAALFGLSQNCDDASQAKLAQLCFETFGMPGLAVQYTAILSMLASGRVTGCTIGMGGGVSDVICIYEGFSLKHSLRKSTITGHFLNHQLRTLLAADGFSFTTVAELQTVESIKTKCCRVAVTADEAQLHQQNDDERSQYELPDGTVIAVGHAQWSCPETIFYPASQGVSGTGMHELAWQSIEAADVSVRAELAKNVVLSGASTMFDGMPARIQHELAALHPQSTFKVIAAPERNYFPWVGGSIFASLSSFENSCISREEYDEVGPDIVRRKMA